MKYSNILIVIGAVIIIGCAANELIPQSDGQREHPDFVNSLYELYTVYA